MTSASEWLMKCEHCGGEWSMPEPTPENVYCPYCGEFDKVENDD